LSNIYKGRYDYLDTGWQVACMGFYDCDLEHSALPAGWELRRFGITME
jgi:hypothetical protein